MNSKSFDDLSIKITFIAIESQFVHIKLLLLLLSTYQLGTEGHTQKAHVAMPVFELNFDK